MDWNVSHGAESSISLAEVTDKEIFTLNIHIDRRTDRGGRTKENSGYDRD